MIMLKKEMARKGWRAMGIKMGIAAAAVVISLTALPGTAEAKMGNGSFVSIAGGAVDSITVNGVTVEALYEPYDSGTDTDTTYSCAAFVKRFYSEVYGRDVYGLNSTTSIPLIDQGSFAETNSPKVGDILRDNQSVHWAIVKEVNGNTVTVIQQNAWNSAYNKAWVGATVDVNDSRYTFFRWSGNEGEASQASAYHDFSFNYHSLERTDTNAVIHTKVNNPEKLNVKTVGCYIYDGNDNLIKRHEESCQRNESRFNIWYDLNDEVDVTLTPGTRYSYQFYVIYDGVEYQGAKESFMTTGTAPENETDDTAMMSKECGPAPSLDYAEDGWMSLQELARSSEQTLYDRMSTPEKEDGNKKYYAPERCGVFSTMAPVMAKMENGSVESITWKYTYPDSTYEAESKAFYEGAKEAADAVFGVSGNGICKDKDNMTATWDGIGELQWNMEDGVPTITITVE